MKRHQTGLVLVKWFIIRLERFKLHCSAGAGLRRGVRGVEAATRSIMVLCPGTNDVRVLRNSNVSGLALQNGWNHPLHATGAGIETERVERA